MKFSYIDPNSEGFLRKRRGKKFIYIHPAGKKVAKTHILRIQKLTIPPAWDEVWICKNPTGHIQVTGLDPKGRKQYIYHQNWLAHREEEKFRCLIAFAKKLPKMRRTLHAHLNSKKTLSRERVLAACVMILDRKQLRVGNDAYAKENQTYGLSTVRKKHVSFVDGGAFLSYRGKKGIQREVRVSDKKLMNIIRACYDLPGLELFKYKDGNSIVDVKSDDINEYIREITGLKDVSAKTFRTWWGCVHMLQALNELKRIHNEKKVVIEAYKRTAKCLNNTVAVCKKSYVDPNIIKSFEDKELWTSISAKKPKSGISREESQLAHLLNCYYSK